jgi:hypothetical protein
LASIHRGTRRLVDLGGGAETRVRIELWRGAGGNVLDERLGVALIDPIDELKHLIQ